MTGKLDGKVALISGGARGQGASHARYLAREGARVIIGDVLKDECELTAQQLRDEGYQVQAVTLDVRLMADWQAAVDLAENTWGRLDILVNNAGMMTAGDLEQESEDGWDYVIDVNQKGQWLGMKAAAPLLRSSGGGSIINVASTFAIRPPAHSISYAAAKGAVRSMTRNAAMTLARDGIRVNAIVISMVDTPFLAQAKVNGAAQRRGASYPLGRLATVDDVSPAVVFLASSDSAFMTGSEMVIDGGSLAGMTDRFDAPVQTEEASA